LSDQFVAKGLFLLANAPSTAGHPKGALSVDGRGNSDEAMEAGLGLLGFLLEYIEVSFSVLELNMLKPLRLVATLREWARPLLSGICSPETPRFRKGRPLNAVEKLVRRFL
jgi:hypothetical protein